MGGGGSPAGSVPLHTLLRDSGLPRHEAERLLLKASGLGRAALAALGKVDPPVAVAFRELAARRDAGEPLQYLEGTVQFGPIELAVDERALVPRPETEQLWELVVSEVRANPPDVVVDLCTGCGNLALALKHQFEGAEVYGTDVSDEALALAAANANLTGLAVTWSRGDLFDALPVELRGRVDLLVANPPYLSEVEMENLPIDVRDHEPRAALVAGRRGDEVLERIAALAGEWLHPGAVVACEISEFRADRAQALFRPYGGRVVRDLAGRPRFVVGRMPVAGSR